jgi:hypothetical protein
VEEHVLCLGRCERGEVVPADRRRSAGVEQAAIERVGPVKRAPALERVGDPAGRQAVAVGARAGVAPGVETGRGLARRLDRDLARGDRVDAAQEAVRQLPVVVEARDLGPGVDARVGAAGDREPRRIAEEALEPGLDLTLDRPQARLGGPSGERAPVVGDLEAVGAQTSSRKTISVESERRGPSLTIRV